MISAVLKGFIHRLKVKFSSKINPDNAPTAYDIWVKGIEKPEYDPDTVRLDLYGSMIHYDEYNKKSPYGWYIGPWIPTLWRGDMQEYEALLPVNMRNREKFEKQYGVKMIV